MINVDLSNVESAEEYVSIKEGGYVGRIEDVINREDKQGIIIWADIAEGEAAGYYAKLYEAKDFWGLSGFRSYKQTALKYFKKFIDAVESSNPRYKWNGDEGKLAGKLIGLVLKKEEYTKSDGQLGSKFSIDQFVPVADIRAGKYPLIEDSKPVAEGFVDVKATVIEGIPFN